MARKFEVGQHLFECYFRDGKFTVTEVEVVGYQQIGNEQVHICSIVGYPHLGTRASYSWAYLAPTLAEALLEHFRSINDRMEVLDNRARAIEAERADLIEMKRIVTNKYNEETEK